MGQNHSSKTPQQTSNYAPKSSGHQKPEKKGSRSPKGKHGSGSGSKTHKEKSRSTRQTPYESTGERSSSLNYHTRPQEPVSFNTRPFSMAYAGSHTERSAPYRQFSLTRQTSGGSSITPKHAQIEKYFNKYKDEEEDAILADGMEKFCVDLGVDPTEFIVLVLAWKFEASQMCRFTREEFMNGCQKMRAHDAKSLKERFPELLAEAKEEKNFKELYNFTFSFGLDHSTGQRSLPMDMAIPLWDLVFTQNRPVILNPWFEFLKVVEVRGISRDTWNMFLPFCTTILPNLGNYDESEAWPSLFDDFVEHELSKKS